MFIELNLNDLTRGHVLKFTFSMFGQLLHILYIHSFEAFGY